MPKGMMQALEGAVRRPNETFAEVFRRRARRRGFLKGRSAGNPPLVLGPVMSERAPLRAVDGEPTLTFRPIELSGEDRLIVPPGYTAQVLIRWGDPLTDDVPAFDVRRQTAERQAEQFGYNCDFAAYFPLPHHLTRHASRGILAVNHEYTNPALMFPGYEPGNPTREQVGVELAAHGVALVEVVRLPLGQWRYRTASDFNRRISGETAVEIVGPVAGHDWLRVSYDPTGLLVRGTLSNCAGGVTPWGTYLTCEENFQQYFANRDALPDGDPRKAVHARYGLPSGGSERHWELYHPRFDLAREPNEAFRFGWVVEIGPYDPQSVPRKRTALGRFSHEGATCVAAPDGRVAVYSGDDERFEYLYKFVTAGRFNARRREGNTSLLDEGTLYVAKFNDDGSGEWLPLVFGQGPLTEANGFGSQADVLINTRRAGDLLGATKMDRPEDVKPNPVNGKVYCVMTNNTRRSPEQVDAANPRGPNRHGHVIELTEGNHDHASGGFTWEVFLLSGDPGAPEDGACFAGFDPGLMSPIPSLGNVAFDLHGNLWIASDGQPTTFRKDDGVYAVPVDGHERGYLRRFLSGVPGGEVASLTFSPDNHALFCSVQHPAEGGSLVRPSSTWPDGAIPPRPGVIVVEKTGDDGRVVGS